MKNKVNIEITDEGWVTKVTLGDKEYVERHEREDGPLIKSMGTEGNFESEEEIPEELYEALSSFHQFDIMAALIGLKRS